MSYQIDYTVTAGVAEQLQALAGVLKVVGLNPLSVSEAVDSAVVKLTPYFMNNQWSAFTSFCRVLFKALIGLSMHCLQMGSY